MGTELDRAAAQKERCLLGSKLPGDTFNGAAVKGNGAVVACLICVFLIEE